MKRTRILFYFSFIIYIYNTVMSEVAYLSDLNQESFIFLVMHIVGKTIIVGIGYLAICNSIVGLSHLVISIYYYMKGYGLSSIFIYPIMVIPSEKKISIHLNFLDIVKYIYPRGIYDEIKIRYDENKIKDICSNAYLYGLASEVIGSILWGVFFGLSKQYILALSMVVVCIVFISLSYTKTSLFEGLMIMRKKIRNGALPLYLSNQAILYGNDYYEVYKELDMGVLVQDEYNRKQIIETIKHMYMIKAIYPEFPINKEIQTVVEQEYLLKSIEEFRDIYVGEEKYNLLKQYLYTGMILEDRGMRNLCIDYLYRMESDYSRANSFINSPFKFYLDIARNNTINQDKTKLYYDKLIRKNSYYKRFYNYQYVCENIVQKINIICNTSGGE